MSRPSINDERQLPAGFLNACVHMRTPYSLLDSRVQLIIDQLRLQMSQLVQENIESLRRHENMCAEYNEEYNKLLVAHNTLYAFSLALEHNLARQGWSSSELRQGD